MKTPKDKWQELKDAILVRVTNEGSLFINPYRKAIDFQCALELVGAGKLLMPSMGTFTTLTHSPKATQ